MLFFLENKKNEKIDESTKRFESSLREYAREHFGRRDEDLKTAFAAYLLWDREISAGKPLLRVQGGSLQEEMIRFGHELFVNDGLSRLNDLARGFTAKNFKEVAERALEKDSGPAVGSSTPESISKLALAFLDVGEGDRVVDVGCGRGSFLSVVADAHPGAELVGIESDRQLACLAQMRFSLASDQKEEGWKIHRADAFQIGFGERTAITGKGACKVFSNYPLGRGQKKDQRDIFQYARGCKDQPLLEELKRVLPEYSMDWNYNALLCHLMGEGGRAVAVMSSECAWKKDDAEVRRAFVRLGLVESVVELPAGILPGAASGCVLIVFSHGNKGVGFYDASQNWSGVRALQKLSDSEIGHIVDSCKKGEATVSNEQLLDGDCLLGNRHLSTGKRENGIPLGELFNISRGAVIPSQALQEITVSSSSISYLAPKDIVDGMVSEPLPCLSERTEDYKKMYGINSNVENCMAGVGDIVLTKNGKPSKCAVVSKRDERLLVSGNLYILRKKGFGLNVNSEYVAAFLESAQGKQLLQNAYVGGTIPYLDQKLLKDIPVPMPSPERQRAFLEEYRRHRQTVIDCRRELESARIALEGFLEEEFLQ